MPRPISTSLKLDPSKLGSRTNLARHFPIIISEWTDIEDELAVIFAAALDTQPAKAVAVLSRVNAIYVRLDMVRDAIGMTYSEAAGQLFQKQFFKEIRACSTLRSEIVHSHWTTHDDYPDCLIRTAGLSDRELRQFAYDERDFLEIHMRLAKLNVRLKKFAQALKAGVLTDEKKLPAWDVVSRS